MKHLVVSSPSLPAPPMPQQATSPTKDRIEELKSKKKHSEEESRELAILEEEQKYGDLDSQYTMELPELRIVHPAQQFINMSTDETYKKIKGIALHSQLVRGYWLSEEEKSERKIGSDLVGPFCSSNDLRVGQMYEGEGKERKLMHCAECPFNRDNEQLYPDTAGRCKLNQRVLFLAQLNDQWCQMPFLLRLPQSSVRVFSRFYRHWAHNNGVPSIGLLVELSLEKKQTGSNVYSVLQIDLAREPIDSMDVFESLQAWRRDFGDNVGAPVGDPDFTTNFGEQPEGTETDLDPSKEVRTEG